MRNGGVIVPALLLPIVGSMLSMLLGANIFFVKRLVDQLDATRDIVFQLRQEVVVLKVTFDDFTSKHKFSLKGE